MKRRVFALAAVVVIVLAVFVFAGCSGTEDYVEIVVNNGFETVSDASNVQNWTKAAGTGDLISFTASPGAGSDQYDAALGARYGTISSTSSTAAHAYIYQKVSLEKNKTYRLSVYADVSSVTAAGGYGFYVGFAEDLNHNGINVTESGDGFTTYECYFTSAIGGEATLIVGMGIEGTSPYGTVSFDNVSLQSVDTVPDGTTVGVLQDSSDYSHSDGGSIAFVTVFALFSVALVIAIYVVLRRTMPEDKGSAPDPEGGTAAREMSNKTFIAFIGAVVAAFAVRFVITLLCYGMGSEIDSLSSIASSLANSGLTTAFTNTSLSNEPVGVMYVLWIFGLIGNAIGVESGSMGMAMLVRIPAIIADMFVLWAVFSFAFSKYTDKRPAVAFGWLYALMPVFFVFGAMYGSYETIAIAFLVYALIAFYDKSYIASGIFFTFSLLFSHYVLVVMPIYAAAQVVTAIRNKQVRLPIILTMVGSFVLYYLISLPMCLSQIRTGNVFYVFSMINAYFETSAFLSTDAFNMYAMFGAANSTVRNTLLTVCNWLFVAAMGGAVAFAYYKQNNNADLFLYSSLALTLYSVFGAQSTVVILPAAAVLLLIYMTMLPDKRLYSVYGALCTLSFLNIAELISRSGFITGTDNAGYLSFWSHSPFIIVFSVIAVLVAAYYVYVTVDIVRYDRYSTIERRYDSLFAELKGSFASFGARFRRNG